MTEQAHIGRLSTASAASTAATSPPTSSNPSALIIAPSITHALYRMTRAISRTASVKALQAALRAAGFPSKGGRIVGFRWRRDVGHQLNVGRLHRRIDTRTSPPAAAPPDKQSDRPTRCQRPMKIRAGTRHHVRQKGVSCASLAHWNAAPPSICAIAGIQPGANFPPGSGRQA